AGARAAAHAGRAAGPGPAAAAAVRALQRLGVLQGGRHAEGPGGRGKEVARRPVQLGRKNRRGAAAGAARPRPVRRRGHAGRVRGPVDADLQRGVEGRALRRHRPGRAARDRRGAGRGGGGMSSPARDPYLALALDGVHAIEASAGTGKTFTLATLVVRLVVERGLRVSQVMAVTFTEAATQELRSRIRARLLLAERLVGELIDAAADAPQAAGASPVATASPEAALTRAVLEAHLAQGSETADALRRRLHAAANDIDLAAIFTIHGFCARVLREHALEAGQAFDAP